MSKKQITDQEFDKMFLENYQAFDAKIRAKYRTNLNSRYFPKNYEVNSSPSKTIPDQSMSLKTILERFARGLPVNAAQFDPIPEMPNGKHPNTMDLSELNNLKQANKQFINEAEEYFSTNAGGRPASKSISLEKSDDPTRPGVGLDEVTSAPIK